MQVIALKSLKPYKHNNRIHNDQQIQRIADSIKKFGFNQPIVIDEKNEILVGHGRLLAAEKLGLKDAPCIQLTNLSDNEKRAYRILDNKLQNDSTWDFESLQLEMQELKENDFDMRFCGLEELGKLFPEPEPEVSEDEFEGELPDEPFIKLGDLIELGRHRVLCGDSTSAEDVAELMQEPADLMLTDPPYNVEYTGKTKDALTIENDSMSDEDFRAFLRSAFAPAFDNMKAGAAFYIWHADLEGYNFRGAVFDCDQKVRQCLIWVKQTMVMGRQDYQWKHEPCLYGWKDGAAHSWCSDRKQTTVLEFDRPSRSAEHPTMKPIPLFGYQIKNSTKANQIVYDPFLGSGTTLIACEQLNRTCYGMEISPKYCQVILERYKSYCEKNNKPFECKINGENYS
jgi:site-specific DNA-methyltransferase (adenine-specific)